MEWTVCCGGDSATAKGNRAATNITYLKLGPDAVKPRDILKKLLFGLLWLAERSRVIGMAIVLGQTLREVVQVLRLDCLKPFVDIFDLGGI